MYLSEINLKEIYKIWKSGLGEFVSFFRSSPFVSLQTYEDFLLDEECEVKVNNKIIKKIIDNLKKESYVIVDLPLDEIIDLALVLNNDYNVKPILNINLLFNNFGIVGSRKSINKIILNGLKLKSIKSNDFVMLIPYDRYNDDINTKEIYDKLNNQYGIGGDDLPYDYMLKKLGYKKVVILTKDKVKGDLLEYINYLNKEIDVNILGVN